MDWGYELMLLGYLVLTTEAVKYRKKLFCYLWWIHSGVATKSWYRLMHTYYHASMLLVWGLHWHCPVDIIIAWKMTKVRMPPGRLPGEEFRARPTGRRPRGRPRTCWRDYVSRLASGSPPEELEEVAGDRDVWVSLLLPPRPDPRRSGR